MEMSDLVTTLLPILVQDLTSGTQEIAKKVSGDLYELIKSKFSRSSDQALLTQIAKTDDERAKVIIGNKLEELITDSPVLAAELEQILPELKANQLLRQVVTGNDNVVIQGSNHNTINVNPLKNADGKPQ